MRRIRPDAASLAWCILPFFLVSQHVVVGQTCSGTELGETLTAFDDLLMCSNSAVLFAPGGPVASLFTPGSNKLQRLTNKADDCQQDMMVCGGDPACVANAQVCYDDLVTILLNGTDTDPDSLPTPDLYCLCLGSTMSGTNYNPACFADASQTLGLPLDTVMDASITACAEYEGLDVNGDGVIDADEIAAWSQQTVAQMCDQFETFEMSCIDYLSWDLDENLDTGSDTLDNCYAVLAGSSSCTDEAKFVLAAGSILDQCQSSVSDSTYEVLEEFIAECGALADGLDLSELNNPFDRDNKNNDSGEPVAPLGRIFLLCLVLLFPGIALCWLVRKQLRKRRAEHGFMTMPPQDGQGKVKVLDPATSGLGNGLLPSPASGSGALPAGGSAAGYPALGSTSVENPLGGAQKLV